LFADPATRISRATRNLFRDNLLGNLKTFSHKRRIWQGDRDRDIEYLRSGVDSLRSEISGSIDYPPTNAARGLDEGPGSGLRIIRLAPGRA